eukprot:5069687-Pyramimonas_sp.AAC.1
MSHHFQGYARMISPIGRRGSSMWEGDVSIGGSFRVAWQCLCVRPPHPPNHNSYRVGALSSRHPGVGSEAATKGTG